jgi:hypothetical protein
MIAIIVAPGFVNAALLRVDYSAMNDMGFGIQSGSYFVFDSAVANSSTDPNNGLFENAITAGQMNVVGFSGPVSYDLTDTISISTSTDGTGTTWSIPLESDDASASLSIEFSDTTLATSFLDDSAFYNDNFIGGVVETSGVAIDLGNDFAVSSVSPPPVSAVPIPPTFYLMASSLLVLLWRSNFSISDARALLTR